MSISKKNMYLVLVGILIQVLTFEVRIGGAKIDIFSDIIAYALIISGIYGIAVRNKMFKKSFSKAIQGLIVSIIIQAINCISLGDAASQAEIFTKGLSTIFVIYFTYYFNEGVMLEAVLQEKAAIVRTFRISWAVLGVFLFVHFIALMSGITWAALIAQIVVVMCVIYYITTVSNTCKLLYMDGLPKRLQ